MNKHKKQSGKSAAKGNIRIIGGQHRGRKLPVLLADGLRPTTDRVKETVFNWLMPYIHDSRCLDCFAGSGSLGFEAHSRGAKHVTLLEFSKDVAKQLQQNKALLKADSVEVVQTDTKQYLTNNATPFDIIFVDPPFRKDFIEHVTNLLNQGWLAKDALIYVEMEVEQRHSVLPNAWSKLKEKVAGQVVYQLYQVVEQ